MDFIRKYIFVFKLFLKTSVEIMKVMQIIYKIV